MQLLVCALLGFDISSWLVRVFFFISGQSISGERASEKKSERERGFFILIKAN